MLYRVNAGGPDIAATDGGPNWLADATTPFLVDAGSNSTVLLTSQVLPGETIPASVPAGIFATERWDEAGGSSMKWAFEAAVPGFYEVRLLAGNAYVGASRVGDRIFDVAIEGSVPTKLNNIDLSAQFGHQVGGLLSQVVEVTDGTLNIEFLHGAVENPMINGIEIIRLGDRDVITNPPRRDPSAPPPPLVVVVPDDDIQLGQSDRPASLMGIDAASALNSSLVDMSLQIDDTFPS